MLNTTTTTMTINKLLTKHAKTKYISKFSNRRLIYVSDLKSLDQKNNLKKLVDDLIDDPNDSMEVYQILRKNLFLIKFELSVATIAFVLFIMASLFVLTNDVVLF